MPNQFNHESQKEAGYEVHQFWPLVEIQCSPDLKFFLCSMYVPICMPNYHKPLPACRSVCERAKSGCAPLMRQYGFAWPERMRCDSLPEYGDERQLCMDQLEGAMEGPVASSPASNECLCGCRHPLVQITPADPLFNKVHLGPQANCAPPCYSQYFSGDERAFATFWIGFWSVLCCVSSVCTVGTFLIDMQRFKYPERPIIFLSLCYLFVSAGYLVRLVAGHEAVACSGDRIRLQSTGPAMCTAVFLLIYFFLMASSIWWVILSLTWFLAAGLKWGSEAIASYSQYFHLAAWLLPSVQSIAVLATSSVDGDNVSGICFVGNHDLGKLRGFVLIPLCIYLGAGTIFLLLGFISLFRIRSVIKREGHARTHKLEKLMIRIGVFSVLYTLPATVVIACIVYEHYFRLQWEYTSTCPCQRAAHASPDFSVFMLKYFMCLVVGITSGFWLWSGKTLESWRARCCPTRAIYKQAAHV